ncbi:lysM domain containing protein [Musa troglodytarum]|nr:lysM domain containing protein [Musa troglodytarum]URD81510.1 lysM domain containing protein [Musa troglodytarum]
MQADRVRRTSHLFSDDLLDTAATIPISSSATSLASSSSSDSLPRVNYIEHRVSKMDTLPGVAIKYGVEVADIKRLNGLTMDIQMFARKTLQIPLPGRHPPSPCLSNGSIANG